MGIVGLTFYGPHTVLYYWYINPWLTSKLFPIIFSFFYKFNKTIARVVLSAFFDTFVYNLPYFSFALFYTGMLSHYGNIAKAW